MSFEVRHALLYFLALGDSPHHWRGGSSGTRLSEGLLGDNKNRLDGRFGRRRLTLGVPRERHRLFD
jgi:hypothetical protein